MRECTVPLLLLLLSVSGGCAQSGYTRADLIRNCLSEVNYDERWVQMEAMPENAVELRALAYKNLPGLDPANPPRRELWFKRDDTGYLICYLRARTGCGQTTTSILKTSSGWELGPGGIMLC